MLNYWKRFLLFKNEYPDTLKFLKNSGAHFNFHSGFFLMSHLINTAYILRKWQCSDAVQKAALCHNIYGTSRFTRGLVDLEMRKKVRDAIGQDAERLVFLYCIEGKNSLFRNLDSESDRFLVSKLDECRIPISDAEFIELLKLDIANTLEQRKRSFLFSRRREDAFLTPIYLKAGKILPEHIRREIFHIYNKK